MLRRVAILGWRLNYIGQIFDRLCSHFGIQVQSNTVVLAIIRCLLHIFTGLFDTNRKKSHNAAENGIMG